MPPLLPLPPPPPPPLAVYHIRRDRAYWARLWSTLADFWWGHVVPARQEFQAGRWEEVEQYRCGAGCGGGGVGAGYRGVERVAGLVVHVEACIACASRSISLQPCSHAALCAVLQAVADGGRHGRAAAVEQAYGAAGARHLLPAAASGDGGAVAPRLRLSLSLLCSSVFRWLIYSVLHPLFFTVMLD